MRPINKIRQKSEQLLYQWPQTTNSEQLQESRNNNPLLVPTTSGLTNKRKLQLGFRKSPMPATRKDREAVYQTINLKEFISKGSPAGWTGQQGWSNHAPKTLRMSTIGRANRQSKVMHCQTEEPQLCVQNKTQANQCPVQSQNQEIMAEWRTILEQRRRQNSSNRKLLRLSLNSDYDDKPKAVNFSNAYLIERLTRTIRASQRMSSEKQVNRSREIPPIGQHETGRTSVVWL